MLIGFFLYESLGQKNLQSISNIRMTVIVPLTQLAGVGARHLLRAHEHETGLTTPAEHCVVVGNGDGQTRLVLEAVRLTPIEAAVDVLHLLAVSCKHRNDISEI